MALWAGRGLFVTGLGAQHEAVKSRSRRGAYATRQVDLVGLPGCDAAYSSSGLYSNLGLVTYAVCEQSLARIG